VSDRKPDLDNRLNRIAALGEPVRRALYRFVVKERDPVTREQAATGVGVPQHTAKFHLDRLVEDGLLDAGYSRPPGRSGPGAGRPAKTYRRSTAEVEVSLPERRYDLAGHLLVKAAARADRTDRPVGEALQIVAHEEGQAAGASQSAPRRGKAATTDALVEALRTDGYEPMRDGRDVLLGNCPFHTLAREETDLVCGMNLAYLNGLTEGIGDTAFTPELDPAEGRCCVRLRAK
jgi:predicted ArsR family transcriptional regulator